MHDMVPKHKNILIVRTDRIGDVVLTLPLIHVLRENYPSARVSFLVRSYTRDVVDGQGVDEILLYDDGGRLKSYRVMLAELRSAKFDTAVIAFPRFRIAFLLWLAGIRTRVGTGYRWYSFLFNKRVYEHRKTATKHEYEFNLSLVRALGCRIDPSVVPRINVDAGSMERAAQERKRLRLSADDTIAILHPGSGGSARDWRADNFRMLAARLCELGWKVVVTGAEGEESLVREVIGSGNEGISSSVGRLPLKALAAFIRNADLFVSNSTGPLHIAAAVGTPVIGMYPPIVACSPERWGPVTNRKIIFVPDRSRCELCKGGECRGNVCMDQIGVEDVAEAAQQLVRQSNSRRKTGKVPLRT